MGRWEVVASVVGLALVGAIVCGVASCVHRDWQFEDACRREGGAVVKASTVTSSTGGTGNNPDICAKVIQPPISAPVALPDYRR